MSKSHSQVAYDPLEGGTRIALKWVLYLGSARISDYLKFPRGEKGGVKKAGAGCVALGSSDYIKIPKVSFSDESKAYTTTRRLP